MDTHIWLWWVGGEPLLSKRESVTPNRNPILKRAAFSGSEIQVLIKVEFYCSYNSPAEILSPGNSGVVSTPN